MIWNKNIEFLYSKLLFIFLLFSPYNLLHFDQQLINVFESNLSFFIKHFIDIIAIIEFLIAFVQQLAEIIYVSHTLFCSVFFKKIYSVNHPVFFIILH